MGRKWQIVYAKDGWGETMGYFVNRFKDGKVLLDMITKTLYMLRRRTGEEWRVWIEDESNSTLCNICFYVDAELLKKEYPGMFEQERYFRSNGENAITVIVYDKRYDVFRDLLKELGYIEIEAEVFVGERKTKIRLRECPDVEILRDRLEDMMGYGKVSPASQARRGMISFVKEVNK